MASPSHGGPLSVQVLETCVNHCGEKFHNEVAKFRFLNELIKVLSPKVSVPRAWPSLCHSRWVSLRPYRLRAQSYLDYVHFRHPS